jgi:hypothetical protein
LPRVPKKVRVGKDKGNPIMAKGQQSRGTIGSGIGSGDGGGTRPESEQMVPEEKGERGWIEGWRTSARIEGPEELEEPEPEPEGTEPGPEGPEPEPEGLEVRDGMGPGPWRVRVGVGKVRGHNRCPVR